MKKLDKDTDDLFGQARQTLRDLGPDAARERAARAAHKAKDAAVAASLVSSWQENESLLRLQQTGRALTTEHNLDKLLNDIIDAAIRVVGAERGLLMLREKPQTPTDLPKESPSQPGEVLTVQAARNMDREALEAGQMKISRSIARRVCAAGEAILTTNAEEDDRFSSSESIMAFQLRSILCAPLKTLGGIIGVLYMDNRSIKGMFDAGHLRLLELFAGQAAVALENARLVGELEQKNCEVQDLNRRLEARVEEQQVELVQVQRVLDESRRDLGLKYNYDRIVGTSKPMQEIFRLLDRTTDSCVSVLIVGESGTGKELVAKAIHYNGPRKDAFFAAENVSAISETLLESELFGHVRGSFTGAASDKPGLFEVADGGTLFLDEIGDMSKSLQAKLLRALQEGEIRRVGGQETIHVDVRIISATNRNLEQMVATGEFRQDLYYRLNVITIPLPPLRERREDIGLLVEHFLAAMAAKDGTPKRAVSDEALKLLVAYDWPGNVRELENEMMRAVVLSDDRIEPEVLSDRLKGDTARSVPVPSDLERPLKEVVEEIESRIILKKLKQTDGNKSATAKQLGLSRDGLRKKMMRYGLDGETE